MAEFLLSVTEMDSLGVTATHNVNLTIAGTQTVDDVGAELNTYLPLLDAIIDTQIIRARAIWEVDLPGGLKAAPVANSEVQRGMLQQWDQANSIYSASTVVPGVSTAVAPNKKVNVANTDYVAWYGHLLGLTGPAIKFVSKFKNQIAARLKVEVTFRKHRKPQVERSEEEE
jgi:hypothetical protein